MEVDGYLPLPAHEFHILLAMSDEPRNGYQVSQSVERTSNGTVRLSPATQYVNLHRLATKGLLEEVTAPEQHHSNGRRQRFWALSPLGVRVLRAEAHRLSTDAMDRIHRQWVDTRGCERTRATLPIRDRRLPSGQRRHRDPLPTKYPRDVAVDIDPHGRGIDPDWTR